LGCGNSDDSALDKEGRSGENMEEIGRGDKIRNGIIARKKEIINRIIYEGLSAIRNTVHWRVVGRIMAAST
jgi:hypothetical protein